MINKSPFLRALFLLENIKMEINNIMTICYSIIMVVSFTYIIITVFKYGIYGSLSTKNVLAAFCGGLFIVFLDSIQINLKNEYPNNLILIKCITGVLIVITLFIYRIYYKENVNCTEGLLEDDPFIKKIRSYFKSNKN